MSPAEKAKAIEPRRDSSPWGDHEFGRGYAVMILPFSSGHRLGLRVFPQNTFAPYVSVWHQAPDGAWSIYVDGPSLDTTCPRYWGPATDHVALATIEVTWTGPSELRVEMADPALHWTSSLRAPAALRLVNRLNAALPRWTWRVGPLVGLRERFARRYLGLGDVRFAFATASGHETVLVAEETYFVEESTARLDGRALGEPVRLDRNPSIGDVNLPAVPVVVFGEAFMRMTDPEEHERTRAKHREHRAGGDAAKGSRRDDDADEGP